MAASALSPWQLAHPPGRAGFSYFYLIRHFLMVVYNTWYGKLMLAVWTSYFVWLAAWPKTKRPRLPKPATGPAGQSMANPKKRKSKNPGALTRLVKQLLPAMKGRRGVMLACYIAALSTRTSGRLGGHTLVVSGAGFSDNWGGPCGERNSITVGGRVCTITNCTESALQCTVSQPHTHRLVTRRHNTRAKRPHLPAPVNVKMLGSAAMAFLRRTRSECKGTNVSDATPAII